MDLRMPEMNGLETTQQIRAMAGGCDVKIAALTASRSHSEFQTVLPCGLDDFLSKPYRSVEIFDCMARHLELRYTASDLAPDRERPASLSPETLAVLPAEMREQLRNAVIALDVKRIRSFISQVANRDPAVGSILAAYADQFAYTAILNALEDRVTDRPGADNDRQ
jgi:CheY-like chemotaxis protein